MVNSGSSALTLAFSVLNLPKGSEVITPCLNFGTAVSAIVLSNLKPIFVDCEKETLQIDIDEIEKSITKKTKALLIPNLIGNIPDWKKLKLIANKYKLKIIEELSRYSWGKSKWQVYWYLQRYINHEFLWFSYNKLRRKWWLFFLTNNKNFYEKAKVLRSWGRMSSLVKDSENINKRLGIKLKGIDYDKKFVFSEAGYNFEPSEIGASFGLQQLKKFKNFQKLGMLIFITI